MIIYENDLRQYVRSPLSMLDIFRWYLVTIKTFRFPERMIQSPVVEVQGFKGKICLNILFRTSIQVNRRITSGGAYK